MAKTLTLRFDDEQKAIRAKQLTGNPSFKTASKLIMHRLCSYPSTLDKLDRYVQANEDLRREVARLEGIIEAARFAVAEFLKNASHDN